MTSCPKCGSYRISGPSYQQGLYGTQWLEYRCNQCGYRDSQPTHDQSSQKTAIREE